MCENLKVLVPFNLGECFVNEIYIEIYLKINKQTAIWLYTACSFEILQSFLLVSSKPFSPNQCPTRAEVSPTSNPPGWDSSEVSSTPPPWRTCRFVEYDIFLNHNHGEQVKAWRKNLKKKVLSDTLEPPHSPASVLFFFLFTFQLEETLLVIARF